MKSLDILTVEYLKNQMIHKVKINKRYKNLLHLSDVEIGSPVFITDGIVHGGLFGFDRNSMFLTEILIDKFEDVDMSSLSEVSLVLNSPRGLKVQRAKFRDEFLKPLKKWIKNRDISDRVLALSLLKHKIAGNFDELATYLNDKGYSTLNIAIWKRIHH